VSAANFWPCCALFYPKLTPTSIAQRSRAIPKLGRSGAVF
jgi:hypothetical protein